MPRRAQIQPPRVSLNLSAEEGVRVTAHLAGLAQAWEGIRTTHGLAEDVKPCSHVKAAIRLMLFPHLAGITPIDQMLFDRARLTPTDLTVEAGPLAGAKDLAVIAAHAATGCTCAGKGPVFNVTFPGIAPDPVPGLIAPDTVPGFATATVPAYAWEASVVDVYLRHVGAGMAAYARQFGRPVCVHLATAIRHVCAADAPRAAALEVELLARAGVTLPEYRDDTVERWMTIPGDDGTLKAHLDACPMTNEAKHWPGVVVAQDAATRPVRVPGPHGSELKWPDPVWS